MMVPTIELLRHFNSMQKFQGQIVSILSQIISDKNKTLDIINICQMMLSEEK